MNTDQQDGAGIDAAPSVGPTGSPESAAAMPTAHRPATVADVRADRSDRPRYVFLGVSIPPQALLQLKKRHEAWRAERARAAAEAGDPPAA